MSARKKARRVVKNQQLLVIERDASTKPHKLLSRTELTKRVARARLWAIVDRVTGDVPIAIRGRASARKWAKIHAEATGRPHMVQDIDVRKRGVRA